MDDKPINWIGSSRKDVRDFSEEAKRKTGLQLRAIQRGEEPTDFKPMSTIGKGVQEIRIRTEDAYRVFYVTRFAEAIYVLHAFQKKPKRPLNKILKLVSSAINKCLNIENPNYQRKILMNNVTKGSSNVFADLGFDEEEAINLKIRADLMLDLRRFIQTQQWTQAEAALFFGETQPRISNLMNGDIDQFAIDKLVQMLSLAGMDIQVLVTPKAS
jgi:phage-related protein/predicted XRE-type DNA-binding protein